MGIISKDKKPYHRKICDLTIVADHTFYQEVGDSSLDKTVLQMLWHVKEANAMIQVDFSIKLKWLKSESGWGNNYYYVYFCQNLALSEIDNF